jgi:hypothetical protein
MTHTYAILEVSPLVYDAIKEKLRVAGQEHAIDGQDGVIDLHGLALKREESSVEADVVDSNSSEKILEAAADLKEAITNAKAKLLLKLEAALTVGYYMRRAQKNYYAAKTGKQALLIEAKRLEGAFDQRLAELRALGVDFHE